MASQDTTIYTGSATWLTGKTWTKLSFDLTEENKAKLFAEGGARVFRFYMAPTDRTNEDGTATTVHGYIGDFGFDEDTRIYPVQSDEITFVNVASDTNNYSVMSTWSKTYKSHSELTNISGDYNGNAILVEGTGVSVVTITPRITEEQYDAAVAAGYTKMYIWIAAYADNGKTVMASSATIYTGSATYLTDKTWTKLSFDLTEENKAKLFAVGGASVFRFYMTPGDDRLNADGTATTFHGYIGDFGFDK